MLLILARIFTCASLLTPLLVSQKMFFPFISAKAIIFRTLIELAIFFFLLHLALSEERQKQGRAIRARLRHPLALALLMFGALIVFTAFTAENPTQAFWSNFERGEGAFQVLHYLGLFFLIITLFPSSKEIQLLLKTQVAASVLMSWYALGQSTTLQGQLGIIGDTYRPSGTLGNPSYFSAYLLFTFAIVAYLLLRAKTWTGKILLSLIGIFELIMFIKAGTRSAFLALAIGILIIFLVTALTAHSKKTRKISLFLLITALVGMAGVGTLYITTRTAPFWQRNVILKRLLNIESIRHELEPRFWTWGSALNGIIERPFLGWGLENFAYPFDKYYNPKHFGRESFFDRTHNVFLEYLISGGIPLFLAYLSIFFFYFKKLPTSRDALPPSVNEQTANAPPHRFSGFWRSILIAMPIMYLIQGIFLFDVMPIYVTLFLFFGFVVVTQNPSQELQKAYNENHYGLSSQGLIAILALPAVLLVNLYITALLPYQKNFALVDAIRETNSAKALDAFTKAYNLNSLVGQEETVGNYFRFALNAVEQTLAAGAQPNASALHLIVDTANRWFSENQNIFPGVKNAYLVGGLNLRAGIGFGLAEYVQNGKQIYYQALAFAPTRIEIIRVLLEVAAAERDKKMYDALAAKAKFLRPDISWK